MKAIIRGTSKRPVKSLHWSLKINSSEPPLHSHLKPADVKPSFLFRYSVRYTRRKIRNSLTLVMLCLLHLISCQGNRKRPGASASPPILARKLTTMATTRTDRHCRTPEVQVFSTCLESQMGTLYTHNLWQMTELKAPVVAFQLP